MISKKFKVPFTIGFIVLLMIVIIYKKSFKETFDNHNELSIKINFNKTVFFVSDNLENDITQTEKGVEFNKTKSIIKSTGNIAGSVSEFTGFLFMMDKNVSGKIGITNLVNGENGGEGIDFCINILNDFTFEVSEKNEDGSYSEVDLDYCMVQKQRICSETKNKIKLSNDKFYGIIVNNNKVNYVAMNKFINRNGRLDYVGMVLHRSKKELEYPYNIKVIPMQDNFTFKEILWTSNELNVESPSDKWIVEMPKKEDYEDPSNIEPLPSDFSSFVVGESDAIIEAPTPSYTPGISGKYISLNSLEVTEENDYLFFNLDLLHNLDIFDLYDKIFAVFETEDNKEYQLRISADENIREFNVPKRAFPNSVKNIRIKANNILSNTINFNSQSISNSSPSISHSPS